MFLELHHFLLNECGQRITKIRQITSVWPELPLINARNERAVSREADVWPAHEQNQRAHLEHRKGARLDQREGLPLMSAWNR